MSSLNDIDLIGIIDHRFYVIELLGYMGKGYQNVEIGYSFRGLLYLPYEGLDEFPDLYEESVLKVVYLGFGVKHQIFHLLEFRCYEPFAVYKGLLSDIVLRHLIHKRLGYLDIVSEDLVESHLDGFDPCPLPFLLFK